MSRHQAQMLSVQTEDRRIRRPAHSGGALGDGLHDRLEIGRRARDHPQDLSRGGLLLERLFRFVEQADVLDRDDRLGGEGLEQLDLVLGELPGLGSSDTDRPDRLAAPQHRGREKAPEAHSPGMAPEPVGPILEHVGDLHDRAA
jgi:hypothetical protein